MRRPLVGLLLGLLVPLAACGESGTGSEPGIHGTYALRTINGSSLPFLLHEDEDERVLVTRGAIVLRTNGTFTDELHYDVTIADGSTGPYGDVLSGTFQESSGVLSFQPDDGSGRYTVSLNNGRLSQSIGAYLLEYAR
jgi:hypothetical protein